MQSRVLQIFVGSTTLVFFTDDSDDAEDSGESVATDVEVWVRATRSLPSIRLQRTCALGGGWIRGLKINRETRKTLNRACFKGGFKNQCKKGLLTCAKLWRRGGLEVDAF